MKNLTILVCGAAAISLLAGCASGPGYGHRDSFGVAVGYDGYYDNYYGPFVDGYWDNDGAYYYYDGGGQRHRDDGHHFRRDAGQGFHAVHGNPSAHGGGHASDRDGGR